MSEKLEQIKKQIENAMQKSVDLKAEIKNLSDQLSSKKAEQATAILEGTPTTKLEEAIVTLQTKLSGTQQAFEKLSQLVNGYKADEAQELKSIGRDTAERAKAESVKLMSEIYSLIARCVPRIVDLKKSNNEYVAGIRAANLADRVSTSVTSDFIQRLIKEVPNLLSDFPAEILADENSPEITDLRKALNQ